MLQPIKVVDAPNYVKWFRDKEVMRYANQVAYRVKLEDEKKFIKSIEKNENQLTFSVFNEEYTHIGVCGLQLDRLNKHAEFGIILGDKVQWGKGYAGECIKVLGDYLFKKLKFERMFLRKDFGNKKAERAYEKAGFVEEGIMRKHSYNRIDKIFHDQYVMSILKEEWLKNNI